MDGATFEIGLVDKVTGAANAITGSLNSILRAATNAIGGPEKVTAALDATKTAAEGLTTVFGPVMSAVESVGSAIVSMVEKTVVALGLLAAAIAGVVVGMAALAIKAGETEQKTMRAFAALAGGSAQAIQVRKTIDALGESIGMTRAELDPWASKLLAAGVSADKLDASLRAVAAANALLEGGGEKVTSILAKLTEQGMAGTKIRFNASMLVGTGVSEAELMKALGMTPKQLELAKKQGTLTGQAIADALVKVLGSKGQSALAQQANTITSIWAKFKEDVTKLFEGVTESAGYKQFVTGLKSLLGIFKATSPAAKAMHAGIVGAINAIFAAAAKALPYVKKGIELAIIATLKAYIAFRQWRKEGSQLGSIGTVLKIVGDDAKIAAGYVMYLARAFAGAFAIASKFAAIGQQIDQGLANGITAGIGKVTGAIHGLGAAAIAALKAALSIASPSKEFAKLGGFTAAGFTAGIRGGTSGVKAASAGMAAGAVQGAAGAAGKPGAPGKGSGGKAITVTVESGAIVIGGGQQQGQSSGELTEIALTAMIERIVLSQGLGGAGG